MAEYSVYEPRGEDDKSYIGSVTADSIDAARSEANQQYGGPVIVDGPN